MRWWRGNVEVGRDVTLSGLSRVVVVSSALLAVAGGLWPLSPQPLALTGLLIAFAGTLAAARWHFTLTASVVLLFAYIGYGVVRLVAGPTMAGLPFWLAAFAGLAIGGSSWTRWQADDGWRIPLAWWATGIAISWPVFAARDLNYSLTPSLAAGPIITAAVLQMSLALWMDRLLASRDEGRSAQAQQVAVAHWAGPLVVSALITGGAAIYQGLVDVSWLSGEPWVGLGRAVGMMGDANPMGVATGLWAPLAWMLLGTGSAGTVVGALIAGVLWTAAWLSGARTTLILMTIGGAGLLAVWVKVRGVSWRALLAFAFALIGVGAVIVTVAMPKAGPGTPVARLLEATPTSSVGAAAYELFWRRNGYGLAAVEAIKEHPITGVGVGRFAGVSTGYHQRLSGLVIPPDNAQNFWRHTLVEQGVLGFLPILWLTVLTIRSLLSHSETAEDLMMRVMLVAVGVALLFGYPLQDAGIAVTVGSLVAAVGRARARPY